MTQHYSAPFAEELRRVLWAVDYYEQVARELQRGKHTALARYYNISKTSSPGLVRFKAMFFATRLEPVAGFVEQFQLEHKRRPRMLDLGCGYGLETTALAAAGADISGLDLAQVKIDGARAASALLEELLKLERPVSYVCGDILDHEAVEGYDAIYCGATLHHVEPLAPALAAIAKQLKPGGRFFLSDENGYSPLQQLVGQRNIGWTSPRVLLHRDPKTGENRPYGNENIRPPMLWRRHLAAAGLRPGSIKYCRFLPPTNRAVPLLLRVERLLRRLPGATQLMAIGFVHEFEKPG